MLVEGEQMAAEDGDTQLHRRLQETAARRQLAHVEAAHRIGAAQRVRVVRCHVADDAAVPARNQNKDENWRLHGLPGVKASQAAMPLTMLPDLQRT